MRTTVILILAALLLPCVVWAQETSGMQAAAGDKAAVGSYTFMLLPGSDQEGNQSWVRKYEGQRDVIWSLDNLNLLGYNGPWQGFLYGTDVVNGNTQLNADLAFKDSMWVQASTTSVTRRLPIYPFAPAAEPFERLVPLNGMTNDSQFQEDRNDNAAKISFRPVKGLESLTVVADVWNHNETGEHPLIFRARTGTSPSTTTPAIVDGVVTGAVRGVKFETTEPIDQSTTDVGLGANFRLGSAVVSARTSSFSYRNDVAGPNIPSNFTATEPMRLSRYQDTSSRDNVIKLGLQAKRNLSFSLDWFDRDRTHDTTGIVLPNAGNQVVPTNVKASFQTGIAQVKYTPFESMLLTARYRHLDLDRNAPFILSGTPATPQNTNISRKENEGELEATYSGLPSTVLNGSYNARSVKRNITGSETTEDLTEAENPILSPSTRWKTWKLRGTTYLIPLVTLEASYKNSDITNPSFHGFPSKSTDAGVNLSFNPRPDFGLFADLHRLKDRNTTIPAPLFVTVASFPGTPAEQAEAYQEYREAEAGAQYKSDIDTLNIGLYKSLATRLTFDLNYMRDKTASKEFWVIGGGGTPNIGGEGDTTGLPPEDVPADYKDSMWQAGLNYMLNRKWSFRSDYSLGHTTGQISTASLFRLVPPVGDKLRDWQPQDVNYWRGALGLQYRYSEGQQILLEVSRLSWNDKIDSLFSGKYTLVSVGLQTKF